MRSTYHTAPLCINASTVPVWQWQWSLGAALRGECHMPEIHSASAVARAFAARWRHPSIHHDGGRPVTLLLLGLSFMAQPFEALVCARQAQVVGGCVRFNTTSGACVTPLSEVTAGGASCTGARSADLSRVWPPELHGGAPPPRQNIDGCSSHHSLVELSTDGSREGTLRLCYTYTFALAKNIPTEGAQLPCLLRAGEIDAVIALHAADELESVWFSRVFDPAAKREGLTVRPPYLATRDQLATRVGAVGAAAYEAYLPSQLRAAYARHGWEAPSRSAMSARPNRCAQGTPGVPAHLRGAADIHYSLPGLPDHASTVWLSMLATMQPGAWRQSAVGSVESTLDPMQPTHEPASAPPSPSRARSIWNGVWFGLGR